MKVKRLPNNAGYQIDHEHRTYKATREGPLFLCNGILGTMREHKQRILDGGFPAPSANAVPQELIPTPRTWDCVDPCALIVLYCDEEAINKPTVQRTLDCYGWIDDVTGEVDIERAKRLMKTEVDRVMREMH